LANIAFAFGSLPWMPNPTAIHFGMDGTPNGFAHPITCAVFISILSGIMTAVFLGASLFTLVYPTSIGIPNSVYWLSTENYPKTCRRLCFYLESLGIATMLFILFLQWELFRANRIVPPKLYHAYFVFGLFTWLIFINVASVHLYLSFHLPKEKDRNR